MSSILQPGKNSALPSSYRPARLLDTFGKLFAMILLVQNPKWISHAWANARRAVWNDDQELWREEADRRGFPQRGQMLLYHMELLSHLKPMILNLPPYLIKTISSYLRSRTFEESFQTSTSSRRGMRGRVAKGRRICSVLFTLCRNGMLSPVHHV